MSQNNIYSENIKELRDAAGFTTQIFEGYSDVSDYLVNLAGQETLYGTLSSQTYDDGTPVSLTEYQIDPIRYSDMLERSESGAALDRINMINEQFVNLGYQDFDIRNIATVSTTDIVDEITGETSTEYRYSDINQEYLDDPYVTTTLARHILASNPASIPEDLEGQAEFWKTHWNTEAGAGHESEFIEKFNVYRAPTGVEDHVMDTLLDQDADPFKITNSE